MSCALARGGRARRVMPAASAGSRATPRRRFGANSMVPRQVPRFGDFSMAPAPVTRRTEDACYRSQVPMAHAVFLRAANVGGANIFRPAQVAAAMRRLDVVNIGAAGTFVVRSGASATEVRKSFETELPHSMVM